ncbi:MAG: carbamoyltransferase [Chitinophagales bacterium]|nr:carbamoyltransferase [Chitinophagales bacterium]
MPSYILGISSFYHDSAAALVLEGKVIAAAQEERFSRIKHDDSFPSEAIKYALREAGIEIEDVEAVVYYEKPFLKFERILESYHSYIPKGLKSFLTSMPIWIKNKLFLKKIIRDELKKIGGYTGSLYFSEHHLSHAASAFFPSPFQQSAIITLDGVGEWATASIAIGQNNSIKIIKEMSFPNSVGLLYSSFTDYLGFRINNGEYKMMGLAPYGDSSSEEYQRFKKTICSELVEIFEDGSIELNMEYFAFGHSLHMTNEKKWEKIFGFKKRKANEALESAHLNLALAIQDITEDIVIKIAKTAKQLCETENLVLAGGVALNSVVNGKLRNADIFKKIWIQPAAGDAGGAVGAAMGYYFIAKENKRIPSTCKMKTADLGPAFIRDNIIEALKNSNLIWEEIESIESNLERTAKIISEGKIVGFFQGRMEFGPRALGHRSILADPRDPKMQQRLNASIKFREEFRPFAPAILEEHYSEYFDEKQNSPFMLFVHQLRAEKRKKTTPTYSWKERLDQIRSELPSITHVDYSARIQTVSELNDPVFYRLLQKFHKITGCPVLINTSFNLKGEPIVCSPEDAIRCFQSTGLDYLIIENFICSKPK